MAERIRVYECWGCNRTFPSTEYLTIVEKASYRPDHPPSPFLEFDWYCDYCVKVLKKEMNDNVSHQRILTAPEGTVGDP